MHVRLIANGDHDADKQGECGRGRVGKASAGAAGRDDGSRCWDASDNVGGLRHPAEGTAPRRGNLLEAAEDFTHRREAKSLQEQRELGLGAQED